MKQWYCEGYCANWWAKMKREEAKAAGKAIDEEWPFAVYLAADVDRLREESRERVADILKSVVNAGIFDYERSRFQFADRILAEIFGEVGNESK